MNALTGELPLTSIVYAEPHYWDDEPELLEAADHIHAAITQSFDDIGAAISTFTIRSEDDLQHFLARRHSVLGIFTAMSGAVQPWMLKSADHFASIVIVGGFVQGLFSNRIAGLMLERNAAPPSMDVYSVLHEQQRTVLFARSMKAIRDFWQGAQAVERLRSSTILLIGETEPWVVSSSRDHQAFASQLGLQVQQIDLKELYDVYNSTEGTEANLLAKQWSSSATVVQEPTSHDIDNACRVTIAFRQLLAKYNADAVAIACFTLLKDLGTTSCLAVSELNDTSEYVGICEGDLDAGASMLLMKALTSDAAWMGNPVVTQNDNLMLVHCTAPRLIHGEQRPYLLRNHHESGIGVSPAVEMPVGLPVTLCRIGRNATAMSVHVGEAIGIPEEPTCRTQLTIKLPSIERYMATSLGNHQVLSYGDYGAALRSAADILHLTFLN